MTMAWLTLEWQLMAYSVEKAESDNIANINRIKVCSQGRNCEKNASTNSLIKSITGTSSNLIHPAYEYRSTMV
jgi:hypothetical protein